MLGLLVFLARIERDIKIFFKWKRSKWGLLKYSSEEFPRSHMQSFCESVWINPPPFTRTLIVVLEPYSTTLELKPPQPWSYTPISHLDSFSPSASLATKERAASQPYTNDLIHLDFPLEVLALFVSALRTTRTTLDFWDGAVTSCISCFSSRAHAVLLLGIYLVSLCQVEYFTVPMRYIKLWLKEWLHFIIERNINSGNLESQVRMMIAFQSLWQKIHTKLQS